VSSEEHMEWMNQCDHFPDSTNSSDFSSHIQQEKMQAKWHLRSSYAIKTIRMQLFAG